MARRLGHLARERMLTLGELEIFGEPNYDRVSMLERMSMGTPARCHQPIVTVEADVTDASAVAAMMETAAAENGRIDALVNNA